MTRHGRRARCCQSDRGALSASFSHCSNPSRIPPSPGEPSLSQTTWAPQHDSRFTFFVNGHQSATLADGQMAYLTGLPTNKPIRVRARLDGRPFEAFSLDLSRATDHRICLWLYPGYWHWINNGWDTIFANFSVQR